MLVHFASANKIGNLYSFWSSGNITHDCNILVMENSDLHYEISLSELSPGDQPFITVATVCIMKLVYDKMTGNCSHHLSEAITQEICYLFSCSGCSNQGWVLSQKDHLPSACQHWTLTCSSQDLWVLQVNPPVVLLSHFQSLLAHNQLSARALRMCMPPPLPESV